ncbi:hypothetical protein [Nonomuraea sp. NPDC050643]
MVGTRTASRRERQSDPAAADPADEGAAVRHTHAGQADEGADE